MSDYIFEDLMRDITELDIPDDNDPRRISVHYDRLYELVEEAFNTRSNWISCADRLPECEPHRNIEICYVDAANKPFSAEVSSRLVCDKDNRMKYYAWREVQPLPSPPGEE